MPRQANRENGRRGANHTAPTLVKMRLAVAEHTLAVAENKLKEQQRHHTASFEKHVASVVFGPYDSENHSMLVISGKAVDLPKKCSGHRSSDANACRKYGDVSGMLAQTTGLAAFVA